MIWYCVQTKPQKEPVASRYCEDVLGLETYLPLLVREKLIRRVKRTVVSPLFPHYFFCRFDLSVHYRAVNYGPDVTSIVQFGGRPATVGDGLIAELRAWAMQPRDAHFPKERFQPGEAVTITSGVMSGLQAIYLRDLSDSERVEVLLSVLDCGARMVVPRAEIARLC